MVEDFHKRQFWVVFLQKISEDLRHASGASEYEIYFNYMLKENSNKIELRYLNYKDSQTLDINSNFDYILYHHHLR